MWVLTWGPGWWSLLQTDPWWLCPVWQSSSLCFLWWTCRSHLGTHTARSRGIAVRGEAGLAELFAVSHLTDAQLPTQSQSSFGFDQQGADSSNKSQCYSQWRSVVSAEPADASSPCTSHFSAQTWWPLLLQSWLPHKGQPRSNALWGSPGPLGWSEAVSL